MSMCSYFGKSGSKITGNGSRQTDHLPEDRCKFVKCDIILEDMQKCQF